jgi:protein-tyrosine phosphatase
LVLTTPSPDSYWVTDRLLAGKYPGSQVDADAAEKVSALLDAGVRTFVDLTEDGEDGLRPYAHLLPADVSYHRVAVPDVTCPRVEQVREALGAIEEGVARGIVYVHCRGGCGRTGVLIGCYLVEQGHDADAALARVHTLMRTLWHSPCPETGAQVEMVRGWRTFAKG